MHSMVSVLLGSVLLVGCGDKDSSQDPATPSPDTDTDTDTGTPDTDLDGDGVSAEAGDCDDADPLTYPGAPEALLDSDRNCDGVVEGGELTLAEVHVEGEDSNASTGISVAPAGDVDGDGLDDLLIGAFTSSQGGTQRGAVYVVLGRSVPESGTINLADADYRIVGENDGDWAGYAVAGAGDVDGDGLDDILIGADRNDDAGVNAGKAYLIFGRSLGTETTIVLSNADVQFLAERDYDYAGWSLDGAGDVDGDGLGDVLIGAYGNDAAGNNTGKAYLFYGRNLGGTVIESLGNADHVFGGEDNGEKAGWTVSGIGDVNGDGFSDIAISAPESDIGGYDTGRVALFLGGDLGTEQQRALSSADHIFMGENKGDMIGYTISNAGDVDGDGLDDVFIGAPKSNPNGEESGSAFVFLGASLTGKTTLPIFSADHQFVGNASGDWGGYGIGSAGDVDGDGLDDIVMGSPGHDSFRTNAGFASVFLGKDLKRGVVQDMDASGFLFYLEESNADVGWVTTQVGDVNGDGRPDLGISAPSYGTTGTIFLLLNHH